MGILGTTATVLFVIVCLLLVLVILLQSNRSAGLGLMGGGASQTAFGSGSADFLTKATGWLAAIFLVLALVIAALRSQSSSADDLQKAIDAQSVEAIGTQPAANPNPEPAKKSPAAAAEKAPAPASGN